MENAATVSSEDTSSVDDSLEDVPVPISAADFVRRKHAKISIPKPPPVLVSNGRGGMNWCIEAPPDWAWDVIGERKVKIPLLSSALGSHKTVDIQMSNNARHTRIGCQLWARFDFGDLKSCMRFCPAVGDSLDGPQTIKEFEAQCVLTTGCWPGPSPKGQQKWLLRWRGKSAEYGTSDDSDKVQSDCIFQQEKDGILKLSGVIVCDRQRWVFTAEKVKNGILASNKDISVTGSWGMYGCLSRSSHLMSAPRKSVGD